ncbi:MAG: fumarylacetoacetate hydrolase family protein [Pseudomonadota bacterium]
MNADEISGIADAFVHARRTACILDAYPGKIPESLDDGYRIQDAAIALWQDTIGGWKVGQIRVEHRARFGSDRILGPLFRQHIFECTDSSGPEMPLFEGGFAVIEAEYIAVLGDNVPPGKAEWTLDESMDAIADLRLGIETAGSPLPALNKRGAAAVVSDFGAHGGLVVGGSIDGWRERDLDSLECEAFINEKSVGRGGPRNLNDGVARSVQAILQATHQRGHPLTPGSLITTGATTGVHAARPGDQIRVDFGGDGSVACTITAATPEEEG